MQQDVLRVISVTMEAAGIPRGYFDGIEPPPRAGKGDNVYAMSKTDDLDMKNLENSIKLKDGSAGAGGDWSVINERFSTDVVKQLYPDSCVAAVGEMLSDGALKQADLIGQVGTVPESLVKVLGDEWKGRFIPFHNREQALDLLLRAGKS